MRKILLLLIILSSCLAKEGTNMKSSDFGAFSIDLPTKWKVNEVQGIDSYVREIVSDDGDTIHFDFGYYSSTLEKENVRIYPESMIPWFIENKIDTTSMVFLDKEKIEESDREKYRKQKEVYATIDGFSAKIVKPKDAGIGLTGVHFDSLRVGSMGKIMLQISGYNLKPKNSDLLLESIRTIKIKEE